jgi:hypothetical protein
MLPARMSRIGCDDVLPQSPFPDADTGHMPAGRSCRSCGAALPPEIRWCTTCFERVRDLTPRAPLHEGVAGPLRPTGPGVPHWSRWERSATTFGPVGRIAMTAGLGLTVLGAMSGGLFLYVLLFPAVAWVALPAIWAKGWVVPDEPDLPPLPLSERDLAAAPVSRSARVRQAVAIVLLMFGVGVLAQGPAPAKGAVLAIGVVVGMIWFWRRFLPT